MLLSTKQINVQITKLNMATPMKLSQSANNWLFPQRLLSSEHHKKGCSYFTMPILKKKNKWMPNMCIPLFKLFSFCTKMSAIVQFMLQSGMSFFFMHSSVTMFYIMKHKDYNSVLNIFSHLPNSHTTS